MDKIKTAFVTFFPIKPDSMGSSAVVNSRYNCWPYKKKAFQISHIQKINNRNIETIFIKKENPINKILKLPEIILRTLRFLKNAKKKGPEAPPAEPLAAPPSLSRVYQSIKIHFKNNIFNGF